MRLEIVAGWRGDSGIGGIGAVDANGPVGGKGCVGLGQGDGEGRSEEGNNGGDGCGVHDY